MKKVIFIIFIAFLWIVPPSASAADCKCKTTPSGNYEVVDPDSCGTGFQGTCSQGSSLGDPNCSCTACTENGKYAVSGVPCCSGNEDPQKGLCLDEENPLTKSKLYSICNSAGAQKEECESCLEAGGILTAIGCIHTDPKTFITDFLKIALGIAGGIALLLMVYGAFMISISAGDPKKAEEGKEIITGTIAGLLFIIFSVFLLRLIGVQILNIPGF